MSIKTKITALVILSLVIFSSVSYAIQMLVMMRSFNATEMNFAKKEMMKTIAVINERIRYYATIAVDYSAWDDTYKFIFTGDRGYLYDNYNDVTLNNLKLSVFALYDARSNFVYGKMKEDGSGWREVPALEVAGAFHPADYLKTGSSGLVYMFNKPYLFSAQPIIRSDRTGVPNGVLLFGAPHVDCHRRRREKRSSMSISR